jgi:beta-lactam-binding protein with PASTA domain
MISKLLKVLVIVILFIAAAGASAYLTLTLIIKSEETVVVPSLKEKDVVYALRMLSDLGLNTRIKASEYSDSIPVNHVIEQDPAPGSEIKEGRNIKLVISRGQLSVTTPQLTGLSIHQALIILEENGLCQGTRSHSKSFDIEADTIIAQSPQPGVTINRNNCIDLLMSSGRYQETFAMADLTTLPVDEAILKIEAHKLKLGNITETAAQGFPLNTVASQTPPAGYRAVTGQAVHLGINRVRSASRAAGTGKRKSWYFRYRAGDGFLNRHVKVRINSRMLSYDLFDDFISPGEELLFLIPRFENITVMLYEDGELIKTIFPGSRLPVY